MNSEKRKTTHVVMSTVCPIPEWCFKLSLSSSSDIRDLTKPRRRWQQERQKTIGLMSKTTTLHVHHAFLYISLLSLHNYDVKWPNFNFTWERERKAINSTISVWTRVRSLLFSSIPNSLLLSSWVHKDNREKKNERMRSLFSAKFSWTSPLSDGIRSLLLNINRTFHLPPNIYLQIPQTDLHTFP